ncbi:choice-of-anchor L domain-containing protein, partial [Flavobacterium branchiophilum]|uniref:choice-of-anchor L domain-containing protein n=1 Tax=Flavobacterium branchiophilum TaxID=55197 RepID=UPI0039EFF443
MANVTCALPPTCPAPTGLVTSAITSTTLTLAWNTVTPSTSWQVLALPCTAPAPTATSTGWVSATANSLNITGLTPDTCYNFYVRGVCSTTDMSTWAGPKTATTLIAPPVCGGTFVDAGGATNNYPNSSNTTYTICPTTPGDLVTVTFTAFDVEASWDGLYVFDGNSTTAPQIASTNPAGNVPGGLAGAFWGTTIPGPFTSSSTDGCLTFRFRSDASVNRPGWVANVTCAPAPTCKKPNALTATSINLTGATLGWTQLPNPNNTVATAWEVLILPAGSPAPTATTTGALSASSNQYIASGLTSATCYDYYVRAVCSTTDSSFWAGPKTFCTAIANDECANATTILTNSNMTCTNFGAGILIGATASSQTNGCGGTADDDVWFQFVATATTHAVSLTNVTGSTTALNFGVYSGTCTGLTQVLCNTAGSGVANGLIVGQTYFVRIFSATATPGQNTAFNLCIGTIPPAIQTNNTQYTTQQLVQDVLLNSTCATVSNITSSTGSNFGSVNGLASFTQNGSGFPFANGIVLSTGDALKAKGPNTTTLSDGNTAWTGDTDLESIILSATGNPMTSRNATKLEFDFIPISNSISFDFIFASEEYGTFQCEYSDAFAFLLTNTATGVTTNLAVVPNTTDPISVVTVRNQLYNNSCTSVNPNYFAQFNNLPTGINPLGSALNFNGQTVVMTASSPVTSNTLYHIKLVVADRSDSLYDSAVFLKGGSFSIGNLELGNDLLQATGNAICAGSSQTINTGLDASLYTFVWKKNNVVIAGQTGPSLTVTDSGTYTVSATYNNSSCVGTDSVTIEFYPPISAGTPNNLVACNTTGVANFDLTQNNTTLLGSLTGYTVSYFTSSANANSNTNAIASPSNYTNTSNPQTIWARVQNTSTGCFVVKSFTISVQNNMPTFTVIQNVAICAGGTGTITVTPTNYTDSEVTYSWTLNGNAIANSNSNSINVTQAGTYQVSVNRTGCIATASITVTVTTLPVATFAYNATSYCKTGTNPVLSYTNGGVAGTFSASPTGLSINASTGAINLSASSVGSYTITNSIAAAGGCLAVSATFDLTITAPQDATFSYTGTPYCQNAANPSPTLATGSSAGVFSSTTGLSINSSTGLVNLASSTPGTYTVTNTIAATGGCAASIKTATIVITAAPQASIAYGTPFCSSE